MRVRKGLIMRAASVLLLAGTLLGAATPPGDAGAQVNSLPGLAGSSLRPPAASLSEAAEGRIVFEQQGEIYLINPDGTGLTRLTYSDPDVYNYQPALSPDGRRVAFGRVQNNRSGISLIDVDGAGFRKLTTNHTSQDTEPAWSPDGSKIAFVRGYDPTAQGVVNVTDCGRAEIYVVSVDSVDSEIINLTPGQNSTDPAWSPDGQRIAFASRTGNGYVPVNYDIYAITIGGGEVQQLTHTEANEAEPVWSPDGKQIAYSRNYSWAEFPCGWAHTGGPKDPPLVSGPDIYVMSTDGSEQTLLTDTGNNIEPTWSPDGSSLAFVSFRGGAAQIYVLDTNHGTESCITSSSGYKSVPSWSRAHVVR